MLKRKANSLISAAVTALALSSPALAADQTHFTFVHSAWMGGWQWQSLTQELGAGAGYATPDLPAHGSDASDPSDATLAAYAERIVEEIDAQEGTTILVGHSFGGVVASQVAEMRPEKIDALVYVCAFMLPNDTSFMDAIAGVSTSQALNNLKFSADGKTVTIKEDALHGAVGHDVPLDVFSAAGPHLVPEPVGPLGETLNLTETGYGSVPRYYIECTDDRALPIEQQRAMYGAQEVEFVYSLTTSHLPMFSDVSGLSAALQDIAGRERVRKATRQASQAWQDAFNAGDAAAATALYEPDALMVADPFGRFTGHTQIEAFWTDLIGKGAANVEYFNTRLEVLDAKSARVSSQWRMNVASGVITNELWVMQKDSTMRLREDHFSAQ
ncbi:alpha/beta fold hydrolase [Cohaesibacter gelatinilyticus]|uniref:Pimeloyl-ACP methyl ester carboxylesterase n=1 Tax=Cohaesibacter gelatinilyticus TaxID=372072 RepID=A0A285PDS5_9HYPH|nr:alpha/beta fold hydrolase [Cohaesibacter gelatinilyticus]SNZ19377.1 Pimeloyl-ACP methyl ester carboxylesterase [Cohaesibacter gelatinilyticus]